MVAAGFARAQVSAELVADGFEAPLFVTAPDGDSRVFVVEKGGAIRILNPRTGVVKRRAFLQVKGISTDGERGLLGLAFHPEYGRNGLFYVNVTNSAGDTEIRRYSVSGNRNVADAGSGRVILSYRQPGSNHNGGWLGFSSDGLLCIASGDGGSGNDPDNNAQNRNLLLGKILRIDVDRPSGGRAYGIPAGNLFTAGGGAPEIWHVGLRNPFRCSFDRKTGDFYIGDVGQNAREEIDFATAGSVGLNYGWRVFEGRIRTPGIRDADPGGTTGPVFEYDHSMGSSVTGGYVARGPRAGKAEGRYFFGDFVSSRVWSFRGGGGARDVIDHTRDLGGIQSISSFGEDGRGDLYVVSIGGAVYRLSGESGGSAAGRPVVSVKRTPTVTGRRKITLRGTARDADGIRKVVYRVRGVGRRGVAEGRRNWKARVRLRPGENRIVVRAVDAGGARSVAKVVRVLRR